MIEINETNILYDKLFAIRIQYNCFWCKFLAYIYWLNKFSLIKI